MNPLPICFDCEFSSKEYPCRTNEEFSVPAVADAYFIHVVQNSDDDSAVEHWSYDCANELFEQSPDLAWDFVVDIVSRLQTPEEVSNFAAGPLENLIVHHGATIIERIEELASRSARFRFVLTGVWSQGQQDSETWHRVLKARARGPVLDDGDPLPKD